MSAYTVFVTGGLGSGKTQVCNFLADKGARLIDLDEVGAAVRQLPEVAQELEAAFGPGILDEGGQVIPSQLAAAAFKDKASTLRMNGIMFPRILEILREKLQSLDTPEGDGSPVVVEVPLLPECPELASLADAVILVDAPLGVRVARAMERGMSYEDILQRIKVQPSELEYRALATQVLDNDSGLDRLQQSLEDWWGAHGR